MARSCWACGQQNDGGSTHCVNPACGLPLSPAHNEPADTSVMPSRPCYVRMLALPAGITMVIVLAAVHALMAPLHGQMSPGHAGSTLTQPAASPTAATAGPQPSPSGGPVNLALPGGSVSVRPSGPPVPTPSIHVHADGPAPGAYQMRSLNGGCFDVGYTPDQTPMVAQKSCSAGATLGRFDLEALGGGHYRMTAVPQRGINAGQPLCVSSAGSDRMMVLAGCETTSSEQVFLFVETSDEWYQIQVTGGCVQAMGRDARTKACGSSQAQRFTFTPVN